MLTDIGERRLLARTLRAPCSQEVGTLTGSCSYELLESRSPERSNGMKNETMSDRLWLMVLAGGIAALFGVTVVAVVNAI